MSQQFCAIHPVLPTNDVAAAVQWYQQRLGFKLLFRDDEQEPRYAGVGREGVEIHLQWHDPAQRAGIEGLQLRFLVADPDALFKEYHARSPLRDDQAVRDTSWGTREFGIYDPENNALFFYRDLD